jgi:hypothetical protein
MTNAPRDRTPPAPARGGPPYPLHKIVAALERTATDGVVTALADAGFAGDRVEVVHAEDVPGLDEPVGGSGFRGFLTRLNLSTGANLDEIDQARSELVHGHALVLVLVHDDGERNHAEAVLRQHGGHAMSYFGRWTVTTLEGGAH